MMRRLLEIAGYSVLEASDGEQAVELAVQERPALILMDLSLPKLDGLAATRKFANTRSWGKSQSSRFPPTMRPSLASKPLRLGAMNT